MESAREHEPLGQTLGRVAEATARLARSSARLARAEVEQRLEAVAGQLPWIGAALVLMGVGWAGLCALAVLTLSASWGTGPALAVVSSLSLGFGALAVRVGVARRVRPLEGAPREGGEQRGALH